MSTDLYKCINRSFRHSAILNGRFSGGFMMPYDVNRKHGICVYIYGPDRPAIDEVVTWRINYLHLMNITSCTNSSHLSVLTVDTPLRPRRHELCLTPKSWLYELNFIFRMLYNDMYWTLNFMLQCICFFVFVICAVKLHHVSFVINRYSILLYSIYGRHWSRSYIIYITLE